MAPPVTCPACSYPLSGLGNSFGVKCPECGRRYKWQELEQWQREGKYVPPPQLAYWLLGTPLFVLFGMMLDPVVRGGSGGTWGGFAGWIWATVWCGIMAHHSMRRHGEGYSRLMMLLVAPVLGLVVLLLSMIPVGMIVGLLRGL